MAIKKEKGKKKHDPAMFLATYWDLIQSIETPSPGEGTNAIPPPLMKTQAYYKNTYVESFQSMIQVCTWLGTMISGYSQTNFKLCFHNVYKVLKDVPKFPSYSR